MPYSKHKSLSPALPSEPELRPAKRALEVEILMALQRFTERTGVAVAKVEIFYADKAAPVGILITSEELNGK